jgi:hypothetical protein
MLYCKGHVKSCNISLGFQSGIGKPPALHRRYTSATPLGIRTHILFFRE